MKQKTVMNEKKAWDGGASQMMVTFYFLILMVFPWEVHFVVTHKGKQWEFMWCKFHLTISTYLFLHFERTTLAVGQRMNKR